jgi:hypothetical protein
VLDGETVGELAVMSSDGKTAICIFCDPVDLGPPEVIFPNARLIAAAPELLEALKVLDAHLDFAVPFENCECISDASGINAAMLAARAAIEKAENDSL